MIVLSLFSSPTGDLSPSREDLEKPLRISLSTAHPFLKLLDYFQAARAFLLEDHWDSLLNALQSQRGKGSPEEPVRKVILRSEKLGALYHVASVELEGEGLYHKFSLVAAVTEKSRAALDREINTLALLNARCPSCGLPRIYLRGHRDIIRGSQKETLSFVLQEWLEGYHEWHFSRDDTDKQHLCVWDQEKGYYTADGKLSFQLFRQAARTLTLLYDPETSCRVGPWHHAAGDFVIGSQDGEPHVRLTTARGYEPVLSFPAEHPERDLANLLFFFLDMGLRMRLDRFDGVGEVVWIEGSVLSAVMEGFFEALGTMSNEGIFKGTVAQDFPDLLKSFSPAELITVFEPILESYRRGAQDEMKAIMEHLTDHVTELCSIRERFPLPDPASGS
jgi:hypothetical protein